MGIDVTSVFKGYSIPLPELYRRISDLNWSVSSVKWDKKQNAFVAKAKDANGDELEKRGPTDNAAVGNLLLAIARHQHRRASLFRVGWREDYVDELKEIAEAYAKAAVYEPKGAIAFKALGDDCMHRAAYLRQQVEIEETFDPDPYKSAQKMIDDIINKQHLLISRANVDHPVWIPEQVIAYRICHEILGFAAAGAEWDWRGEVKATSAHAAWLSSDAQEALFSEAIAPAAYAAYYRAYGPQKIALFPEFTDPAEDHSIHPSQTVAPSKMPEFRLGALEPGLRYADPNEGWESGIEPPQPNAYLDHGDPLEYEKTKGNAELINSEWHLLKTEDQSDYEQMKQAIVNAFRVVLLSPQKNLRSNAQHYQDIAHIPAGTTNPGVYHEALEQKRQDWNAKNLGEEARDSHKAYAKFVKPFENIIYQMKPEAGWESAKARAKKMIFDWMIEEQERLNDEDAQKPVEKRKSSDDIERQAQKNLARRIQTYIKQFQPQLDYVAANQEQLFDIPQSVQNEAPLRYPAWMGTHLKSIARISEHADDLLKAALEDVNDHNGEGFHFRTTALNLGVPGVGPKVASFAWYLLAPMTSQLATIDTHMMRWLGHDYDKEMNPREYMRFERELKAGRDAAGYGHMPLGQFQHATWDHQRTGPGTHSDHSPLRVVNPKPHELANWDKPVGVGAGEIPDWWAATQPYREEVAKEWEPIAANYPKDRIPFNERMGSVRLASKDQFVKAWNRKKPIHKKDAKMLGEYAAGAKISKDETEKFVDDHEDDVKVFWPETFYDFKEELLSNFDRVHHSKVSAYQATPIIRHPNGEVFKGNPGESIMGHAVNNLFLDTPKIWELLDDDHVEKI